MTSASIPPKSAIFTAHPPGLGYLISLKVWELFSYQGMRAFLVFYLIDAFGLSDSRAALLFGSYAALVLATSVFGGYVADRWLGPKEAMLAGACLIMAGHCSLAAENAFDGQFSPSAGFQIFCLGLALIAVGTGLLKPNVLTMIGRLYPPDDGRRETGYNIYYIGVNVGSFLAPIICGGVAARYGWTWGFAAAAIGMALGLTSFLLGWHKVRAADERPEPIARPRPPRLRIYAAVGLAVLIALLLVQRGFALGIVLAATIVIGLGLLCRRASPSRGGAGLGSLVPFFALLPIPILFEVFFEQIATSLNLFSDRAIDRGFLGLAVSAPQLLSLNSLFVLCLLPPLAWLWAYLGKKGLAPAPFTRFAIGFALMASSFLVLAVAAKIGETDARVTMGWFVTAYLLLTLGELCIAPLLFSLVGQLVPQSQAGLAMGLVLLSFSIGSFGSSLLAGLVSLPANVSVAVAKAAYGDFFLLPAALAGVTALGCVLVGSLLRKRVQAVPVPA